MNYPKCTPQHLIVLFIAVLAFAVSPSWAASPIAASGWNKDVVLGDGETYASHGNPINNSYIWFITGLGITGTGGNGGLAPSGAVTAGGKDFQLQPFISGTSNALVSDGTLSLSAPSKFTELSILGSDTGNGTAGTLTLNFADSSTAVITLANGSFPNWANGVSAIAPDPRLTNNGTSAVFTGAIGVITFNLTNLNSTDYSTRTLNSITLSGVTSNSTTLFALNGLVAEPDLTSPSVITLAGPTSRHIVQRSAANTGTIVIFGSYTSAPTVIEARAVVMTGDGNSGITTEWQTIHAAPSGGNFTGSLTGVPAGGWYQIEVRGVVNETPGSATVVQKIGVGDIFVTAGQSNSANYGTGGYVPADDRVSARNTVNGSDWVFAADTLPIAGGSGGSVWTRLGDQLAAELNIPIGFIAVGVGSTQVSSWLPGTSNYNNLLKPAVQSFPVNGFRAFLWHQGESDSIAAVTTATHASRLDSMIRQSRLDAGWGIPWYLAEASFHSSSTLSSEEPVAAGQRQAVHADPLVFLGPSTDAFHLEDANGGKLKDSVHFNSAGLLDHATQWNEILAGSNETTPRNGNFEDNRTAAITGLSPLADGSSHIVTTTTNTDSPLVIGWRILSASGTAAADGSNGFHNPTTGTYAAAADSTNNGIMPHMNGRHVAMLDGGTAGNYFLHSTRALAKPNTVYTLTVSIGVRDNPASFGNARLEIAANGAVVASASFDKPALDALRGNNAAGTFTEASISWTTGSVVAANQPLAVRIVKESGAGTVIDFDHVRFTATALETFSSWIANPAYGIDLSRRGSNDDPDGDGLNNFTEYAFGLDPSSGSSVNPILNHSELQNTGTFSYTRLSNSTLSYTILISDDLQTWTTATASQNETTPGPGAGVETVTVDLLDLPMGTKFFVRVKAE